MKVQKNRLYAVVTGDVIASSKLSGPRRRSMHAAMSVTSKRLRVAFRDSVPADVEIFRGDSWQMMLTAPDLALRAALFYRAGLRSQMQSHRFDIRLAIAIGTIDFVPANRVSQGDGKAFRLSGEALEAMSRSVNMSFRFPGQPEEETLGVVVQLIDSLAARWSDKQSLAITGALQGWKQDKIARNCWAAPISQQAVAQHLNRGAWNSVEAGVAFFERTVQSILARERGKLLVLPLDKRRCL